MEIHWERHLAIAHLSPLSYSPSCTPLPSVLCHTFLTHPPPPHLSGHDPPQQLHQHWLQQQGGSTRYRPQCQLQSRVQHQHAALAHPADEAAEDGDDVLRGKMWT